MHPHVLQGGAARDLMRNGGQHVVRKGQGGDVGESANAGGEERDAVVCERKLSQPCEGGEDLRLYEGEAVVVDEEFLEGGEEADLDGEGGERVVGEVENLQGTQLADVRGKLGESVEREV